MVDEDGDLGVMGEQMCEVGARVRVFVCNSPGTSVASYDQKLIASLSRSMKSCARAGNLSRCK
ncbi:hypothetical protein ACFPZI_14565 [Streptomyces chlorus]|uniref:Uncharacterized protein n=1 Tax=Streptomyces chlorus TaxID=887452 RepID=A0ABW1DZ37_9ACTN